MAGWAVLAGHTKVQDPHINFRNAFAGSSHSGNDVSRSISSFSWVHSELSTVRNSHVEDSMVVLRVVERKLCHEQRQRSCEDLEDRRPSSPHNLCRFIYSGQCRILCVSTGTMTWNAFDDQSVISAASTDEILNSGVTVASIFFGKVFGKEAQRALTVFVALRCVIVSARISQYTYSSMGSALGNVLTVVRLFDHEHGVENHSFIYLDIRGFSCESR